MQLGSSYSGCELIQTRPTAADMTLPGKWYRGPAKIHNPHISVLYIFCEVKFKFSVISMLVPFQWLSVDKRK